MHITVSRYIKAPPDNCKGLVDPLFPARHLALCAVFFTQVAVVLLRTNPGKQQLPFHAVPSEMGAGLKAKGRVCFAHSKRRCYKIYDATKSEHPFKRLHFLFIFFFLNVSYLKQFHFQKLLLFLSSCHALLKLSPA